MLVISRAQMEVLNRPFLDAFRARVADGLRQRFPALCASLGEQGVGLFVEQGIAKARHYGIRSEDAVYDLVELMAQHGASFETAPGWEWAIETLTDRTRPGDARVNRLKSQLDARAARMRAHA
ncbi:MAG: hypothetical protein HY822_07900 [Acidobacteria bacterium]|nr:hypothetical protein [Acidobacteriota bacterium]